DSRAFQRTPQPNVLAVEIATGPLLPTAWMLERVPPDRHAVVLRGPAARSELAWLSRRGLAHLFKDLHAKAARSAVGVDVQLRASGREAFGLDIASVPPALIASPTVHPEPGERNPLRFELPASVVRCPLWHAVL